MGIGRRLTKNTGMIFFSNLASRLISLVFIAYAARVLGPADFGIYGLIGSVSFYFLYFGNLGIGPMAVREMARDKTRIRELFNHILSLRMSLIILTFPVIVCGVYLTNYKPEVKYLLYIAGLTSILTTFSNSFRILYMAYERFKMPSVMTVIISLISTSANIVVLYAGYGLKGIVWITFLGSLTGAVISGIWVRRKFFAYRIEYNYTVWKNLLTQSFPIATIAFFQQANRNMNMLLLSLLPGPFPAEVAMGYFNTPSSIGRVSMMIPTSFRQAAIPAISSHSEDLDMIKAIINKSTAYLLLAVVFPMIIATTFFSREIITTIFGTNYLPSAPALTLLGWGYALQIYNAPVSMTLSASRQVYRFVPWAFLFMLINVLLAVPLIIWYSFTGAALAFLISKIFETMLRTYLLSSIWGIKRFDLKGSSEALLPMGLSFFLLIVVYSRSPRPGLFFLISLLVYSACFVYMTYFKKKRTKDKNE